jgi:acyl-CoA synthetase (AMP-forming)/AMP-acid ligase II
VNEWTFSDVLEVIADELPDARALVHGERRLTWRQMDMRASAVAHHLVGAGLRRGSKVAQYLYNAPEYMESIVAAFKVGMVPVNTNYRYVDAELAYLWENADAEAVVFHGTFLDLVNRVRADLPGVRSWLWVDDGTAPCPPWAAPYDEVAASRSGPLPWRASSDDLMLLYTGGTTGMPKGVMWRQGDLFRSLNPKSGRDYGESADLGRVRAFSKVPGPRYLAAAPLMHGTGLFGALSALTGGGSVTTMPSRAFDPLELLNTLEKETINSMAWVGDAFARPVVRVLDAHPGRWDLTHLRLIASSGLMWSQSVKEALLRHLPNVVLADMLGSSEGTDVGLSRSRSGDVSGTAHFKLGPHSRVIGDDGRAVKPGSGEIGRLAVGGTQPIGYYKDAEKTANTFMTIDGVRYSVPGDYGIVEADGTVVLLGRGSGCINTGGEKVFPEEVEEVLKRHGAVRDAAVVGLPDERFGEVITALVELQPGESVAEDVLVEHVRRYLALYKAPKRVFVVPTVERAPNGKLDYRAASEHAAALSVSTPRIVP